MNNVTGRGEATGCVCRKKKRERGSSSSSFTTPFSFHSPPLPCSPNPLSCRPHCRRSEREEKRREAKTQREAEGETGVGCLDVHEHAERRACGRAMTAMLSPKIRQTRRGKDTVCLLLPSHLQYLPAAFAAHPSITHIMSYWTETMMAVYQIRG